MAGGFYFPKGRRTGRVWVSWNGKMIWVNQYLDGSPIYVKEQAERILNKIRAEIDEGIFDPATWWKDKALLFKNAWGVYQSQSECGKDRKDQRQRIYETYFREYWSDKSLKEIEENHICQWWETISKDFEPSYRRLILVTLKAFFHFFSITRQKMFKFPVAKVPKKAIPWLTQEEQEMVFEFILPQHQGIIRFIMVYGCRPSEACNLKKSDIDWGKKVFTFRERKALEDNTLPVLAEIEAILRLSSRKVEHLEYAFCTVLGNKYVRQTIDKVWSQANRQAHDKYGVRIVCLKNGTRHSKASQLINDDVSTATIARILGNSQRVVERSYAQISTHKVEQVLHNLYARQKIPVSKG